MIIAGMVKNMRDIMARLKHRISGGAEHLRLGRLGEDLAVNLLRSHGYRILDRNLKVSGREVDVIALDGEILAFVEVKTRSGGALVHPLLAVDGKRQARLRQAARFYAAQKKLREVSIRFDVVTLDFSQAADGRAELIKNAF